MYYAILIDQRLEDGLEDLPECTVPPIYFESREEIEEFIGDIDPPSYLFAHWYYDGDLDTKFAKVRKDFLSRKMPPHMYQLVFAEGGGLRLSSIDKERDLRRLYEARVDTLIQMYKDRALKAESESREHAIRTIKELKEKYGIE